MKAFRELVQSSPDVPILLSSPTKGKGTMVELYRKAGVGWRNMMSPLLLATVAATVDDGGGG